MIVLVAFALRAFHLGAQDIWWDEARNIFTAGRPLAAIASAPELDIHPPLYFYLLHFWTALTGTSEFAVRFFSLWFGVALVPLLFRLGTHVKDRPSGWWAAFFVSLAPILVDEAQQTRMYTLLLFLSTLSVYLLLRALGSSRRAYWVCYALAAAAGLYVHYSFAYVLAAENAYLAFRWLMRPESRRRLFVAWSASQLFVAVVYLFQVPNIFRQMGVYGNPGMTPPSLQQYVAELAVAFPLGQKIEPSQVPILGLAFVAALLLGLGAVVANRLRPLTQRDGLFVVLWLVVPLAAYYLVLLKSPQFTPRYILVAVVPFFLLLALLLATLARYAKWLSVVSAVALLLVFAGAWQSLYFDPAFFSDDTRGLARFISEQATKDDIVLIDVPFPFDYYYRGAAPARYLPVDIHTTAEALTSQAQNRKRLYFISWYKSDTDPRGFVTFLLDKYAVFQGERDLRGYSVAWYALPEEPNFALAASPRPAAANYADQVMLTAFAYGGAVTPQTPDVNAARVEQKSRLWVALWWITLQTVTENYKVSVVMRDANGNTVAQDDRMLIDDHHMKTRLWNPLNETAINVYTPELAEGVKPGEYDLVVIVYDPETGKRLSVESGDAFTLGKVEVLP